MAGERDVPNFAFVGGLLCLDFINTQVIENGDLVDLLRDFDDLVSWSVRAEAIDAAEAKEALKRWSGTREGKRAFEQALEFRAALRDMIERMAKGKRVEQATIDAINLVLAARPGYAQLVRVKNGYERRMHSTTEEASHLIAPVADSASELLCHGEPAFIKQCKNPACVLYFYDATKNHRRSWCSMSACGNRMKVAAHYRRKRRSKT